MATKVKITTSALAALFLSAAFSGTAEAENGNPSRATFRVLNPMAGTVDSKDFERLYVTLRLEKSHTDEKWNVCAEFQNSHNAEWSGGYRITATDRRDTYSTLTVGPKDTVKRCETLPKVREYYVVLDKR